MSLPLICFAIRREAAFLRTPSPHILLTGIGPANARRCLQRALSHEKPPWVLSCGFAGGLNPALTVGTVLFSADDLFPLASRLAAAGALPARFHFSERIICRAEAKQALHERHQADAVEMESQVIRSLCREHGVPSCTLRAISDSAQEDLPLEFNLLLTPENRLHAGRLFWAIARRPRVVIGLWRLQRQSRLAARRLASVLNQVLCPV